MLIHSVCEERPTTLHRTRYHVKRFLELLLFVQRWLYRRSSLIADNTKEQTFYRFRFLCLRDWRSRGILFLSCLSICPPLWNFSLAYNFWTVSARALIFHMSFPFDKTFPWVPLFFFTLLPWPWHLTLKKWKLTLVLSSK